MITKPGGDELVDEAEAPSARKAKQPRAAGRKLVAAAEAAEADAVQTVDDRREDVIAAQRRCDDLRAQLTRAERDLAAAESALGAAEHEHADAHAVVAEARRRLSE